MEVIILLLMLFLGKVDDLLYRILKNVSSISLHVHAYAKDDLTDVTVLTPEKIITHPKYSTNDAGVPNFDIALLKVPDMTFDNEVMPICLPDPRYKFVNLKAAVMGWGKSE